MDSISISRPINPIDVKPPKSFSSLTNGAALKKHYPHPLPAPVPEPEHHHAYRECLKNHAASLGVHALDGCGEFIPSLAPDIAVPSSLLCASCGCHRNFHRRVPFLLLRRRRRRRDDGSGEEEDPPPHRISPPPPTHCSASHTLLALSSAAAADLRSPDPLSAMAPPPTRKRFRTRFTAEQKGRMQDLSERLEWRMRRRDEGFVEEMCREIGVGKRVFKVWMHNNKHSSLCAAGRREGFVVSGTDAAGSLDDDAAAAGAVPNGVAVVDGDGRVSNPAARAAASGGACSSSS